MQFCEETLPDLIKHPADTWTNISPFIAGLATLVVAKRPLERLLGASAYSHASNTILGETLDLSGMFFFILSIAALQQYRATPWIGNGPAIGLVVFAAIALTVLSTISAALASPLFAALVVMVIIRGIYDRKWGDGLEFRSRVGVLVVRLFRNLMRSGQPYPNWAWGMALTERASVLVHILTFQAVGGHSCR